MVLFITAPNTASEAKLTFYPVDKWMYFLVTDVAVF